LSNYLEKQDYDTHHKPAAFSFKEYQIYHFYESIILVFFFLFLARKLLQGVLQNMKVARRLKGLIFEIICRIYSSTFISLWLSVLCREWGLDS